MEERRMGRQFNPTPREGLRMRPSKPERRPTSGLLVEVNVSQHEIDPVSHSLTVTGERVGGGKPPSSLTTGVAEAATPLATAKAAMKETKGLKSIIVKARLRLW
jgi:hypothetical protein